QPEPLPPRLAHHRVPSTPSCACAPPSATPLHSRAAYATAARVRHRPCTAAAPHAAHVAAPCTPLIRSPHTRTVLARCLTNCLNRDGSREEEGQGDRG